MRISRRAPTSLRKALIQLGELHDQDIAPLVLAVLWMLCISPVGDEIGRIERDPALTTHELAQILEQLYAAAGDHEPATMLAAALLRVGRPRLLGSATRRAAAVGALRETASVIAANPRLIDNVLRGVIADLREAEVVDASANELLVRIACGNEQDIEVRDPACGLGFVLMKAKAQRAGSRVCGGDIDQRSAAITQLALLAMGDGLDAIEVLDALGAEAGERLPSDVVVSTPPFEAFMPFGSRTPGGCGTADDWIRAVRQGARQRAALLVPATFLTHDRFAHARAGLLPQPDTSGSPEQSHRLLLQTVVTMPRGTVSGSASRAMALIVLDRYARSVTFIDGAALGESRQAAAHAASPIPYALSDAIVQLAAADTNPNDEVTCRIDHGDLNAANATLSPASYLKARRPTQTVSESLDALRGQWIELAEHQRAFEKSVRRYEKWIRQTGLET